MTIAVDKIVTVCSAYFFVTKSDIYGPRRQRDFVRARQAAMALTCELRPDLSLPAIGRAFDRDHTTIMHGRDVSAMRRASDADYDSAYTCARNALKGESAIKSLALAGGAE